MMVKDASGSTEKSVLQLGPPTSVACAPSPVELRVTTDLEDGAARGGQGKRWSKTWDWSAYCFYYLRCPANYTAWVASSEDEVREARRASFR